MVRQNLVRFEMNPARFLEEEIKAHILENHENCLKDIDGSPIFEEPLVGFAASLSTRRILAGAGDPDKAAFMPLSVLCLAQLRVPFLGMSMGNLVFHSPGGADAYLIKVALGD